MLARVLTGVCVGLNLTNVNIYLGSVTSSRNVIKLGAMADSFSFSMGAVWASLLAYLALDKLGWQRFILVISIPIFIPPILLLHFVLPIPNTAVDDNDYADTAEVIEVPNYKARLSKVMVLSFLTMLQGNATILLFPYMIQKFNGGDQSYYL